MRSSRCHVLSWTQRTAVAAASKNPSYHMAGSIALNLLDQPSSHLPHAFRTVVSFRQAQSLQACKKKQQGGCVLKCGLCKASSKAPAAHLTHHMRARMHVITFKDTWAYRGCPHVCAQLPKRQLLAYGTH